MFYPVALRFQALGHLLSGARTPISAVTLGSDFSISASVALSVSISAYFFKVRNPQPSLCALNIKNLTVSERFNTLS